MAPKNAAAISNVPTNNLNNEDNLFSEITSHSRNRNINCKEPFTCSPERITSKFKRSESNNEAISAHLLRLSIKEGEYTYAKPDDIIMIESSNHLTIVHVAQQVGKVKVTIRNSCLKDFLVDLPEDCFLRVNRFCAVNLKRLSGGSYHQQFFEFDFCIKVKPKHPISHAIFNSIGK